MKLGIINNTTSLSILVIEDLLPNPSAKPSTILHITRAVTLAAKNGVINVAILHRSTLHIKTFLAPSFVAHRPPENENYGIMY